MKQLGINPVVDQYQSQISDLKKLASRKSQSRGRDRSTRSQANKGSIVGQVQISSSAAITENKFGNF